jgi:hypothetical protein
VASLPPGSGRFLTDHLAGSWAGSQSLDRCRPDDAGTDLGRMLDASGSTTIEALEEVLNRRERIEPFRLRFARSVS